MRYWQNMTDTWANEDDAPSFGVWLRRRRAAMGLTQAMLAKQIACAPITLRKLEAEERRPSGAMAQRLADCLRVPIHQQGAFLRFARGELRAGAALGGAPPPATTASTNAPIPPYGLIGRGPLLARAMALLREARLLTLVGPPGAGKTRLALEAARVAHEQLTRDVMWVELAPVRHAALVPAALAQALRIEDSDAQDTAQAVMDALRHKTVLLALDNFEQVMEAAPFVAALLAQCAGVSCLITSRERLRVRAEHALSVPPLALPADDSLRAVRAAPASQLFLARAAQANADFAPAERDAPHIGAACARLDGLPLALELLAARADAYTPAQLLAELTRGLDALEDGPRDLPERHRTMRNAIRWSAGLLSGPQRAVFAHLAVFAGGFDAAAAQAVHAHDEDDMRALARASLIEKHGNAGRWRMLEPVRQFAEEMLAGRGELQAAQARHGAYFAALAETARGALLGAGASSWMARLEAEHANLQAALGWAIGADQAETALRIGQGIFRFWHRRGMWREALGWLEQALGLASASATPDDVLAKAHYAAGVMAQTLNRFAPAEQHFEAGLRLAYRAEDDERVASLYCMLGILRKDQGRFDEALDFLDKSLEFQTEPGMKFPWQSKADVLVRLGRFDEAEAYYRKAMALNRKIEDEEGLAHTLRGLAEIAWRRGDPDTAEILLRENETICHALKHARALSWTAQQLGNVARVRGQWRKAEKFYAAALAQLERMGDRWGMCEALIEAALLRAATRRWAAGARALGAAQAGIAGVGGHLTEYERGLFDECRRACAAALSAQDFAAAWAAGGQDWREGNVADKMAALLG